MASLDEKAQSILDEKTRRKMGEIAVKATKEIGYTNAGTIEFLVDKNLDFLSVYRNDIISRKTAYVNGQKITGILPVNSATYTFVQGTYTLKASENENYLGVQGQIRSDIVLQRGANIDMRVNYQDIANAIGLTADKIKSGETILGVTGTYTGE